MKKSIIALFLCSLFQLGSAQTIPGELLVQVDDQSSAEKIEMLLAENRGILPHFKMESLVSAPMRIWLFSFDPGQIAPEEALRAMQSTNGVRVAQFNHLIAERDNVPDDPFFGNQWYHIDPEDNDIDSELAWDITTGGTTATGDEIVACVVETSGAKWDQADILPNHWVNIYEIPNNGIDDDNNGYIDDYDGWNISTNSDVLSAGNHGTQVSSMIGAKGNNTTGITGVNWDVKIMQVQMGGISEANAIAAYTYPLVMRKKYNESNGSEGAFVVVTNSSWGTDNGQASSAPLWCAMYDSLGFYGVLSCGATANNNVNIDVVGDLPTTCPSDYLISVTATNSSDIRTFSGFGTINVDLGAPGEQVYLAGNTSYGNTSGTSFSSPCTAGAIALLYSAPCTSLMQLVYENPSQAAQNIRQYVLNGTDPVSNLATEVGSGGRLNLNNSLLLLLDNCSIGDCFTPYSVQSNPIDGSSDYIIDWGVTSDMLSFMIQYRIVGSPNWIIVSDVPAPPFALTGLGTCEEYEIQIMAICTNGESAWSTPLTWTSGGCCEHPSVYNLSNVNDNSATITWNEVLASSDYTVFLYESGNLIQTIPGIIATSYTFTNLNPCASYLVEVHSNCAGSEMLIPTSIAFNTVGCGSCDNISYCEVTGDSGLEWIGSVQLGSIDNTTGNDNGYGNYTSLSTTIQAGQSYIITCTPAYAGFAYSEYFKVWIDYNSDGTFDDGQELIFDPQGTTTAPIATTFTVPTGISSGSVRMRVVMSYMGTFTGGPPVQCGSTGFGEAEDYCITLDSALGLSEFNANKKVLSLYPNPSSGLIQIQSPLLTSMTSRIVVTDFAGKIVYQSKAFGLNNLNVQHLSDGMYFFQISDSNTGEMSMSKFTIAH